MHSMYASETKAMSKKDKDMYGDYEGKMNAEYDAETLMKAKEIRMDKKRKKKDRDALSKASKKRRARREARMDNRDDNKEAFDIKAEKEIKLLSKDEKVKIKSIKDNAVSRPLASSTRTIKINCKGRRVATPRSKSHSNLLR